MDTKQDTSLVKTAIREGDTGQAIQILEAILEQDGRKNADFLRTLRVVEANYAATRQQALKGILSFTEAQREYSKANDTILSILSDLESGKTKRSAAPRSLAAWLLAGIGGALLAVVAWYFLSNGTADSCPIFEADKKWKIMLLPFHNVGASIRKPETVIQTKIRELTQKNNLSADIEINKFYDINDGLPDLDKADKLCTNCNANFIVWGFYEAGADSTRVTVQYKFPGKEGADGNFAAVTKEISALANGTMTKTLDDAILSLCGMIAMREGNKALATKWFNKVVEKDKTDQEMLNWLSK